MAVPVCVVTCKVCMHERSWQATANSATATTTTTSSMPKSATINHANNHNSTRSLSRSHALTRPPARPQTANCLSLRHHHIKSNQTKLPNYEKSLTVTVSQSRSVRGVVAIDFVRVWSTHRFTHSLTVSRSHSTKLHVHYTKNIYVPQLQSKLKLHYDPFSVTLWLTAGGRSSSCKQSVRSTFFLPSTTRKKERKVQTKVRTFPMFVRRSLLRRCRFASNNTQQHATRTQRQNWQHVRTFG